MEFEFDGFTTIQGRNYIGKSATLRAINAALTNQQGTNFIRWGAKFCEVRIKTETIDILWHKEKGNNFYKINDEDPYTKVGNLPPPQPILDAGFGEISVAGEKVNLLYAEQFHPLFLIDRKDSKSADLLISIYGLDKLYKAIDLCAKDQKKNTDVLKLRKVDLEQATEGLNKFAEFDKVKEALTNVETLKTNLYNKQNDISRLKSWLEQASSLSVSIKKIKPARSVSIPSYEKIDKLIAEQVNLKKYQNSIDVLKNTIIKLRPIKELSIPKNEALESKISEFNELNKLQDKYESLSKDVNLFKQSKDVKIPDISDSKIKEIAELKNIYKRLTVLATEVKTLRINVASTDKELEKVTTDLSAYNACPVCGNQLNKE